MNRELITAGGQSIVLSEKDRWLQNHLNCASSYADTILDQINLRQLYRPLLAGKKNPVVLDIGANIGLVSLHLHDVCRWVVAVEPSDHFDLLCHVCRPYPNILPWKIALSDRDEPVNLWMCDGNSTMNSTISPMGGRNLTVEGMTLSTLLRRPPLAGQIVDLVKVDIEGAENVAINEREVNRNRGQVREYYVEVHPAFGASIEQNCDYLEKMFAQQGYLVSRLPENAIWAKNELKL